jgi:hypothetical protein
MLGVTLTEDAPVQSIPNEPQAKPSHWTPEFSHNAIIEWYCGECHKAIYWGLWNATYCPHCNAPIFNFPRRKLDAPQHNGMSYADLERMKYAGPDQLSRMEAKRKAHPGGRPGKSSRSK